MPTLEQLNHVVSGLTWDAADLNRQRIKVMLGLKTEGDGALIFDDTGFAKQGPASAAVARQYSGTLGRVANCQVTINCHLAERTLAWPVATRLYLHQTWAQDWDRRSKAHVPAEVVFKTKPEIALDLLDEAKAGGVRWRCVVADAEYGDNPVFLNGLERRKEVCCVALRSDFRVSERGRGPTQRVDERLREVPRSRWKTIGWSEGSRGRLRAKFASVRCWRVDGDGTRHLGWLIGQRPGRGQGCGEWKFFWASFPARTPLEKMVEYTHRRHWVEQFHEEAKGLLGWDQFQGRRSRRLRPPRGDGDAGLQLPGVARMARASQACDAGPTPQPPFPPGGIDGVDRWRRSIGPSSTGSRSKRSPNWSRLVSSITSAHCGFNKVVLS